MRTFLTMPTWQALCAFVYYSDPVYCCLERSVQCTFISFQYEQTTFIFLFFFQSFFASAFTHHIRFSFGSYLHYRIRFNSATCMGSVFLVAWPCSVFWTSFIPRGWTSGAPAVSWVIACCPWSASLRWALCCRWKGCSGWSSAPLSSRGPPLPQQGKHFVLSICHRGILYCLSNMWTKPF